MFDFDFRRMFITIALLGGGNRWCHYCTRAAGLAMAVGAGQADAPCLDRVI